MTQRFSQTTAAWLAALLATAVLSLGVAAPVVHAQEGAATTEKKAAAKPQNPWVKLCLDEAGLKKDKEGKIEKVTNKACYTMTERLDINTGLVLSSIKLRSVKGEEKKALIVTVPLGMALGVGVRMLVYSGPQWKAALKKEKVDEKKLKEVRMKYLSCDVVGCDAGVEASKEIIDSLKAGAGVNILALNTQGRIFSSPMPLKGFTSADKGKPVDNKKYANARRQLMAQIQKRRQAQIAERQAAKELQDDKAEINKRRKENAKKQ